MESDSGLMLTVRPCTLPGGAKVSMASDLKLKTKPVSRA